MLAFTLAAAFVALAHAQSAPDWKLVPKACATQCGKTIEASYLCDNQYKDKDRTAVYGCFCEAYPSDAADCGTCLTSNNAGALAALLNSTKTDCETQSKACTFACDFPTCDSEDIKCQCEATYLGNIYNCASCNTAANNTGTRLDDFDALRKSCAAQNYTGADQNFSTFGNAPTGTASYAAPELTATGGGEAATGSFPAATDKAAQTGASESTAAPSASASGSASGAFAVAAPAALVALVAGVATLL
ncbi:hypothetical protein CspeluHIS016_0503770 [Cutaneotrichosporon spelunceum]|uniref:Extracellular membrane protein CFEM domain-containing protein n=1 Tax=Cutaneotrichosporon spelunceum TaxID=1672016 RepID=A0AAD3TXL4_9TREE|nr:hypothetical protein CspeluHIS016_0503770 [Cutaneotrichosporon spelunceum]